MRVELEVGMSPRLAQENFRRLLEAAPDAMVIAGSNGRIVLVNAQAAARFRAPGGLVYSRRPC